MPKLLNQCERCGATGKMTRSRLWPERYCPTYYDLRYHRWARYSQRRLSPAQVTELTRQLVALAAAEFEGIWEQMPPEVRQGLATAWEEIVKGYANQIDVPQTKMDELPARLQTKWLPGKMKRGV